MNFDQLKYFVNIATTLNYSRSSQLLNVTQPALSLSIARLEEEIGFPLFVKKGRNIELSPYGTRFATYANTILKNMDTALEDLAAIAEESSQSVSVALNICFNYDYSLDMFKHFKESYPQYLIDTMIMDHSEIVPGLQHGDFFFAVTHNSPQLEADDNLEIVPLGEYPLFAFVSENNPLAKENLITRDMLSGNTILVSAFNFKANAIINKLYPSDTYINVVADMPTTLSIVGANDGVITGNYTYTKEMKDKGIVRIPYNNKITHYVLAWNKNRILNNASTSFRDFCCEYIKKNPIDSSKI